MVLSASEKIKQCREYFEISQNKFKNYGIKQHYISMIEAGKRTPSSEMLEAIYSAFEQLTDGEIWELYTREQFLMTESEQIRYWFEKNYPSINQKIKEYDKYTAILKKYKMYDLIIENNICIGEHYRTKGDFEVANKLLFKSLVGCEINSAQKASIYREIGLNLSKQSNYQQACNYFYLALTELKNKESIQYYQLCFDIGYTYCLLKDFKESNKYMKCISNHHDVPKLILLRKLLEAAILEGLEENKKAQMIYIELINNPLDYLDFMYATFQLAKIYYIEENYYKALNYSKKALDYSLNDYHRDITRLLISKIYKELKDYSNAIKYCELAKNGIIHTGVVIHVKEWYEQALTIFCLTKDYEKAEQLLDEVSNNKKFSGFSNEIKLLYLKYLYDFEQINTVMIKGLKLVK